MFDPEFLQRLPHTGGHDVEDLVKQSHGDGCDR